MKVALIGAEIEENLAMRSIAAGLLAAEHEVRIFDFHAPEQLAALADEVAAWGPGLAGMSMIFTVRAREFMDLAQTLRDRGWTGHLTAGGHFAAFNAREILRDCPAVDSIVHGEGEEPMLDLARDPAAAAAVPGLTVRLADGSLRHTGPRPNPQDLDARPWSLRPEKFHQYLGQPIASVLASRGCWADCAFCSINAFHRQCGGGRRYRERAIDKVAEEMARLYHDRGVRIFNFQDDNFLVPSRAANLRRCGALRDALRAAGVGRLAMQVKARPDCIDDETVALLKSIGLFRFFLGIETDAVVGLRTLGRGIERAQNREALEVVRRHEIHTCFNLLMFDPESDLEALAQNVEFMKRQSYFPLNFCRVEVYAGTAIEARLRREGRLVGSYLGWSYRIADPRAQRAYEVFREVFWDRNFGPGGLHHLSMKVDYELHVLKHFHPERACRRLEATVKGLVGEVNRSSAELMERVLEFAGSPAWDDPAAVARTAAALKELRAAADRGFRPRIDRAVRHIAELAAGTSPALGRTTPRGAPDTLAPARRPGLRAAAAAASAAALLAALPGCRRHTDDTHMCEMAPPPYENTVTGYPTMDPSEAVAVSLEINRLCRDTLAAALTRHLPDGALLEITLGVEADGRAIVCTVGPNVGQELHDALCTAFSEHRFASVRDGGEVRSQVRWSGAAVVIPPDDTHMCEMAPPPYDPFDSHMVEMAPYPYPDPEPPPPPPQDQPQDRALSTTDAQVVKTALEDLISLRFADQFRALELVDVDLPVWLVLDRAGTVLECSVAPLAPDVLRAALCAAIASTHFAVEEGGAGQLDVRWTGLPPARPDDTRPVDIDQTHMCEAAPAPWEDDSPLRKRGL